MNVRAERRDPDVLFAGNLFCDLVFGGLPGLPEPGGEVFAESFTVSAGGTANRCVASARLGLRTGVAATVGDDLFGRHLLATLSTEDNLDLSRLRLEPSAPTPVSVSVANDQDRSFITYDRSPSGCPDELPGELPRVRACHLPVDSPLPRWAGQLRSAGSLLVGGVGWDRTEMWSGEVLDRVADVDVFCPNEVEAMRYTAGADVLPVPAQHPVLAAGRRLGHRRAAGRRALSLPAAAVHQRDAVRGREGLITRSRASLSAASVPSSGGRTRILRSASDVTSTWQRSRTSPTEGCWISLRSECRTATRAGPTACGTPRCGRRDRRPAR